MKGAIIGDIIGSAFVNNKKTPTDFQLFKPISSFTQDTVLTMATAEAISNGLPFEDCLKKWVKKYPYAGYQRNFKEWVDSNTPRRFIGNGDGAARRISPIGLAAKSLEEALEKAEEVTSLTHNQPEKIKASKAVTASIYLAKTGKNKRQIKKYIEKAFGYNLEKSLDNLQHEMSHTNLSTPAPAAITVFLWSDNYENAIRKAVCIGGPSNTIAGITGAIAQAYYKHIPRSIIRRALNRLTPEMERLISAFEEKHLKILMGKKEISINLH